MNSGSLVVGSWLLVAIPGSSLAAQTSKALHHRMINPASDALFALEQKPPKTKAAWASARKHALVLRQSGKRLMADSRASGKGRWMTFSRQFFEQSDAAIAAIDARNTGALTIDNGDLLDVCQDCHAAYRDKGRSMR